MNSKLFNYLEELFLLCSWNSLKVLWFLESRLVDFPQNQMIQNGAKLEFQSSNRRCYHQRREEGHNTNLNQSDLILNQWFN